MKHFDLQRNKDASFWLLQVSGWSVYGFLYYLVYYFGKITALSDYFAFGVTFITGFLISILLRYIYREIPYKSLRIVTLSVIVVAASIIAAGVWYISDILCSVPLWGYHNFMIWVMKLQFHMFIRSLFFNTIILLCWSSLYFVINFWIEWKVQMARTEHANLLAQSAQLQMLRYQLNPHFLFNALNSIRALIEENKASAKNMVTELAEFLRYALISKNYSDVPLHHEIEAIRHYFAIEKKRYEDKLEIEIDIDPLAEDYPVLSFLIHPLVENAVKYGMKTSSLPLKIKLLARVINGRLNIQVCNTGTWVEPESETDTLSGTGTGLMNVQRRLENAFPGNHAFHIAQNDGQVCITIEIQKDLHAENL